MYLAYCSEYESDSWSRTLFYNSSTEMDSRAMIAGKVDFELGKAGTFTFTLPNTNFNAEIFHRLTSFVDVQRSGESDYIFSGRVFEISKDFDDSYTVTCEGLLALFNDVVVGPKIYKDTLRNVVTDIINEYNDSAAIQNRINLRTFSIDPDNEIKVNKTCTEYETAMTRLSDLVDEYGGYLQVIKVGTTSPTFHIDWIDDEQATDSIQTIDFGNNLLDITQTESNTEDIVTVLIPLGASLTTGDRAVTIQTEKSDQAFGRYLQLNVQEKEYRKPKNNDNGWSLVEWTLIVNDDQSVGGQNFDTYAKVTIGDQVPFNKRESYYYGALPPPDDDDHFPALAWIENVTEKDKKGNDVVVETIVHNNVSGTLWFEHNADGTLVLPISLDYNIYGMLADDVVRGVLSLTDLNSTVTGNSVSDTCDPALEGRYFKLTVREDSYSAANNSSVLYWELEGFEAKKYDILAEIMVTIAGNVVYQINGSDSWDNWLFPSYLGKQSKISGQLVIQHEQDGTKVLDNNIILYCNICNNWDGQQYHESSRNMSLTLTPLANKPTIESMLDTNLTIETATSSNGLKYIENQTGIATFGRIVGTNTWEDINDPDELYETAVAYLEEQCRPKVEIEVSAVDLSMVNSSIPRFKMGTKVLVNSRVHGINNERFMVRKQSINLIDPANDTMTIGEVVEGYIRKNRKLISYYQRASMQQNILNQLNSNPEFKSKIAATLDEALTGNGYVKVTDIDKAATQAGYIRDGYLKLYYLDADNIEATYATIHNLESYYITAETISANYLTTANAAITYATIDRLVNNYMEAGDIVANYVSADSLNSRVANLGYLTATQIAASYIQTQNLDAALINAGYIDAETIAASYVQTANLNAAIANLGYATVTDLAATYATIDMANVNNAWIENGVIKNNAIGDAQIIGVSANKLTAGTIDASQITVTNLNATNITAGSITVDGITIDIANNEALIDGGYIEDGTITLNGLASEVINKIDGAIESFTATAIPTLNNYPASDWTTNDIRATHIGDVCYVVNAASTANGYCYRFAYDNTTSSYGWVLIKDSDVTKALSELSTVQGDISGLQDFQSDTETWITETDEGLRTLKTRTTTLETNGVKSSVQLWFTKADTTAPSKPTSHITSTATTGNAWTTVVPEYNASYPYYYYCWEYQYVNDSYGWSAVVRDIAMGETQSAARNAQATANNNIQSTTMLWFAKANTTAPDPPSGHITSTATTGNAWRTVVPVYDHAYPYYFYCYEYLKGDGTYSHSPNAVYDGAVSSAQKNSLDALAGLSTKVETTTFNDLVDEVDEHTRTFTTYSTITRTLPDGTVVTGLSNVVNSVSQTATENHSRISNLSSDFSKMVNSNLLVVPYYDYASHGNPYTSSGITWTLNEDDNTITANGTVSSSASYYYFTTNNNSAQTSGTYYLPAGTYTLSGCPQNAVGNQYRYDIHIAFYSNSTDSTTRPGITPTKIGDKGAVSTNVAIDRGEGVTFTIDNGYYARIYAGVYTEAGEVTDLKFSPMLEEGETRHSYQDPESSLTDRFSDLVQTVDGFKMEVSSMGDDLSTKMSSIEQTVDGIDFSVYMSKEDWEEDGGILDQVVSASYQFTAKEFVSVFESYDGRLNDLDGEDGYLATTKKYIRFEEGDLILSKEGSSANVTLTTDALQFKSDEDIVAEIKQDAVSQESYIDITNAYIGTSLRIGNFEFVPRSSGNLSFRKRS